MKFIILSAFSFILLVQSCLVQDYCNDRFFDFLHTEDVNIKILKCTEGKALYPKIIKVASVNGNPTQINNFISKNGFYQTKNYEGRLGYDIYKPYSESIKKMTSNIFMTTIAWVYICYTPIIIFL